MPNVMDLFEDIQRPTKRRKVNGKYPLSTLSSPSRSNHAPKSAIPNHNLQNESLNSPGENRQLGKDYSRSKTTFIDSTTGGDIETDGSADEEGQSAPSADSAYHSMSTLDEASEVQEEVEATPSRRKTRSTGTQSHRDDAINDSIIVVDQSALKNPGRENPAYTQTRETGVLEAKKNANKQGPKTQLDIEPSADDQCFEDEDHHPIRSGKRQRRKSQKYLMSMPEATPKNATPVHTPRKRGRPRKLPAPTSLELNRNSSEILVDDKSGNADSEIILLKDKDTERQSGSIEIQPVGHVSSPPSRKRGRPPKAKATVASPFDDTTTQSTVTVHQQHKEGQTTMAHLGALQNLLQDAIYQESLTLLKTQIMNTLTGKRRNTLVGLDEEYQKVHQLIEQTIVAGEGNSMLVIGARGSAKTTLVETVLSQMSAEHRDDFHIVRLNGFIQTTDKLALKDIWRQLGREMEVEDDTMGARGNYADTLASLLALLSHPTELSASEGNEDHTAKSVIFIMDEFDLFASHPRQTLLYNLFDIAQSRKAPIAILGLTTKVNVVESLEKRVKSRFSHRYVHLSLPASFLAFREICKSALAKQSSDSTLDTNTSFTHRMQKQESRFEKLHNAWSMYISSLLHEDTVMDQMLRQIYAQTKSVSSFFAASLLPIISTSPEHIPTGDDFALNALSHPDSKLHMLPSLSELELSLLIAAARLDIILDTDTCNFSMAYDEYTMLAGKAKLQSSASGAAALGGGSRVWGREVAMGAWERLESLELLVPVFGVGASGTSADVGRAGKLWKIDVGLEEIGASRLEMSSVMAKWCREI